MRENKLRAKFAVVLLCFAIASLVACAPPSKTSSDENDFRGNDSDMQVVLASWSPEADCQACHEKEQESMGDAECLGFLHANETCASCHSDDGLVAVHQSSKGSTVATSLKKTEVDEKTCTACHGSYEELVQETADYVELVDSRGTVVNPHAVAESNERHISEGITCSDCHKMHSTVNVATQAKNLCLSCHHSDVFECNTCHEE